MMMMMLVSNQNKSEFPPILHQIYFELIVAIIHQVLFDMHLMFLKVL